MHMIMRLREVLDVESRANMHRFYGVCMSPTSEHYHVIVW